MEDLRNNFSKSVVARLRSIIPLDWATFLCKLYCIRHANASITKYSILLLNQPKRICFQKSFPVFNIKKYRPQKAF